jgi:predicted anti-sigma-YlaC factor YlaD
MKLERDMTCTEIVELITEYLEGGLSTVDRERFEEHIGFCDWCLAYLDQMRHTISVVGEIREEDLPDELQQSLLSAFRDWKAESA